MYNSAVVTGYTRLNDGRLQLNVNYTGNAEEPLVSDPIVISANSLDVDVIRRAAMQKISILNASESVIDIIRSNLPHTVDLTTPLPGPPASTFGQYMAATTGFNPGAAPQDVFTLANLGQKKITLLGAGIATIQTTAGSNTWCLLARTTLNTLGTSVTVPAVPLGSGFPAATAEVRAYTVNPTAGALAGRLWAGRVASPAPANAGIGNANLDLTATLQRMSVTIPPGVMVAFNFNGAALPAGLGVAAWFAWSES